MHVGRTFSFRASSDKLPVRHFIVLSAAAWLASSLPAAETVTFHKDIEPILQRNCQSCHRPGEAAPMSFMTYGETRPWAKAIKQAVATRKMPPWFADPTVGHFKNERRLNDSDIAKLTTWVDSGAKEGSSADAPQPVRFTEGWGIGKPDQIFEMPVAFKIPAKGTVEYQYIVLPTGFTEDKWVSAMEARPGNRILTHHIIAFIREPGSRWLAGAKPGVIFTPDQLPKEGGKRKDSGGGFGDFLVGYAPGVPAEKLEPGQAKLIKAGSDIVFQLHYTANGKEGTDISKIGLIYAKEPPKERIVTLAASNGKFAIPPGADNYRVDSATTVHANARLISFLPHMHMRGKAFEMRLVQPSGEKTDLLRIKWDFNWQLSYEQAEPIYLRRGSKIEATGWFDNSANNAFNPDPSKEVKWGDQSWEEMMIGFFNVAIDAKMDPKELLRAPKQATSQPSTEGLE